MFRNRKMVPLGIALYAMMLVSGCSQMLNASIGVEKTEETGQGDYENLVWHEVTDIDKNISINDTDYVSINISQPMSIDENVEGCALESGSIIISKEGDYVISGESDDCRLIVNAYDDEVVHLFLENVKWKTEEGSAIYVERAGKVVITLIEGTENIISDGTENALDVGACIFSNSDLTINGSGKLSVYGYCNDAVRSKDRVKLVGTNLYIKSQNDGIRGNDGVICEDSMIRVESKGTGIRTNSEKGYVVISGGKCQVIAGENAVFSDDYVTIHDCDYEFSSAYEEVRCNGVKELEEKSVK